MSKEPSQPKKPETPLNPQALDPDSELPPDADVEERFNDFWKNNGSGIFGGIAVGAVVVLGIQTFSYLGERKEAAISEAFAAADAIPAKVSFAEEHPDHQLGALARLQVADARFDEGDAAAAADLYAEASRGFDDPTLRTRALLGQGMSLLLAGSAEAGASVLETVALDASALDHTRGEAAYHLAVHYWEAGELEKVRETLDIVLELQAPFWVFRANALLERLNLATDAEEAEPGEASPAS